MSYGHESCLAFTLLSCFTPGSNELLELDIDPTYPKEYEDALSFQPLVSSIAIILLYV